MPPYLEEIWPLQVIQLPGPLDLPPITTTGDLQLRKSRDWVEWLKPSQGHSHGVQSTIRAEWKLAGFLESKDTKAGRHFKRSFGSLASLQVTNESVQDYWLSGGKGFIMPPTSWFKFALPHSSSLSLTKHSLAVTLSVIPTSVSWREQGFSIVRPHLFFWTVGSRGASKDPLRKALWGASAGEGRLVCIFGSSVLCPNARQLHFPDPPSSRIIFPREEKAEDESMEHEYRR